MPRRDGTGPMGDGAMTGRQRGFCTGANTTKNVAVIGMGVGLGFGLRRGFDRGFKGRLNRGFARQFDVNETSTQSQKDLLLAQKELLKEQMQTIDKQLENL